MSQPPNPGVSNARANWDRKFDELVLDVAHGIFSQALGKNVADVLRRNFQLREPELSNPETDRTLILQRILAESFGEFHSIIMELVMEQVFEAVGVQPPDAKKQEISEVLAVARKAYYARAQ